VPDYPRPVTSDQHFFATIVDRLEVLIEAVNRLSDQLIQKDTSQPNGDGEAAELVQLTEPVRPTNIAKPASSGPGSGSAAWATYASAHGVHVTPGSSRATIIAACQQAGIAT
jgi:hypothetical protein